MRLNKEMNMKTRTASLLLSVCVLIGTVVPLGCTQEPPIAPHTVVRDGFTVVEGPRIKNMRDLGSLRTADGQAIRKGRVYRSAAFDYSRDRWYRPNWTLPQTARDYLVNTLGIKTDLDLRREGNEVHHMTESPLGKVVNWIHIPSKSYANLGTEKGRVAFKRVFATFLDERNYPIVFHCRIGRDRAGAVAFILEALLGVSESDIRRDWEYTERAKGNSHFKYEKFDSLRAVFTSYPGVTINEKVAAYVKSLGYTDADISKFCGLMIEK